MDEREIAIRCTGVTKEYRLGEIGGGTLQRDLQSWWARKRGKEDPNIPIGRTQHRRGERFMALNGVDLTVYKGEALGIIGANGAGKSTLLKILSRITGPTAGEIDIYGRISSMLEVGTGFHGQLTGRENIYFNGAILGMTRAEIDAKIEDIIDFSEVREFIDTPVKRYSSGMFVKLAFSVAAHLNSEILVMDEVLAVGDAAFQKKCLAKMREVAAGEGRTVLYVSHNMNTIRELCDRCIVLDKGRIVYDGQVEQAVACYMEQATGETETDMDLLQKPHTADADSAALWMEHLSLPDRVTPIYGADEDLTLQLRVAVKKPTAGVQLRLTLRSTADEGVGTSWSRPMDFPEPGSRSLRFRLPLHTLSRGTFYCSIGLYRRGELGEPVAIDHITRAFRMELRPGQDTRFWDARTYGYSRLPEAELIGEAP